MLRVKVRAIAIDASGNERDVWIELDVSGQSATGNTVVCDVDGIGTFTVEAEPGKFNPWGRVEAPVSDNGKRARTESNG